MLRMLMALCIGVAGAVTGGAALADAMPGPENAFFTATGALQGARAGHTATLLPNGKVLVAGGFDGSNWLATVELFDPAVGKATLTSPLRTSRSLHTATLLPDGKVLVAGGNTAEYVPVASTELYDPAAAVWTTMQPLHTARAAHGAALLADGWVLVAGGMHQVTGSAVGSAEIYDPAAGGWTKTGDLTTPRAYHTLTVLTNGMVLVTGGRPGSDATNNLASAELYDPQRGRWEATGSMNAPRAYHAATRLADGRVLVTGGENDVNDGTISASAELFDPASGMWSRTGAMAEGRFGHRATLLPDGNVLVTGGGNGAGSIPSAELYVSATGTWRPAGSMRVGRLLHTATLLPDGGVLIAAGVDLGTPQWLKSVELFQRLRTPVAMEIAKLPGGRIELTFSGTPGTVYRAYATADLAAPFGQWRSLGAVPEVAPGEFQIQDVESPTTDGFYGVVSD